ncbi:MAG: glutamate racemase [Bacteroidetes bacterium]|nr:glutamate racemase [Bacteroidota bacterium]MCL6103986.1 glutamate racemase [Bacteroidota bacterium]
MSDNYQPIGVFDSGYGGLTIFKELLRQLPQYDYIYLGDNARNPYGTRSFEVVYEYTWQAVSYLFAQGCQLVVLACNTASAKALRNIQQKELPGSFPDRRVLGVIRPSVEMIPEMTKTGHVGVLGTKGTVVSESYPMEIAKISPKSPISVVQEACPMWVPIVENNLIESPGAAFFVEQNLTSLFAKDPLIDTIILGCTHYPLLTKVIRKFLPEGVRLLDQGPVVADKLEDYLYRHPEMELRCSKSGRCDYYTTESTQNFDLLGNLFMGSEVKSQHVKLG